MSRAESCMRTNRKEKAMDDPPDESTAASDEEGKTPHRGSSIGWLNATVTVLVIVVHVLLADGNRVNPAGTADPAACTLIVST
jgi:hypothetical protein